MKKQAKNFLLIYFIFYLPAILIFLYLAFYTTIQLLYLLVALMLITISKYILLFKYCKRDKNELSN